MGRPRLKFCSRDIDQILRDKLHRHPYWQVEFIFHAGSMSASDGTYDFSPHDGDLIVIPPLVPHRFERPLPGTESCSFKFVLEERCERLNGWRICSGKRPFFQWIGQNLRTLACMDRTVENIRCMEYLLMDLLFELFRESGNPRPEPDLPTRLNQLVQMRGREINVQIAAMELGMTVSQLKYQFRRESPSGCGLKKFLDEVLASLIENYLEYSKLSIGEIARAVRFPDIYSMSHFYRRIRGRPPKMFSADSD